MASHQYRQQPDCPRGLGRARPGRTGRESAGAFSRLQRRCRWVSEEGQSVVVCRVPQHRGRTAVRLAPRRPCDAQGRRRDREADPGPSARADTRRIPAARDVLAIELLPGRPEPTDSDERCPSEHRVPGERLEGRVQRSVDERRVCRGARRRLLVPRESGLQEHSAAHRRHRREHGRGWFFIVGTNDSDVRRSTGP